VRHAIAKAPISECVPIVHGQVVIPSARRDRRVDVGRQRAENRRPRDTAARRLVSVTRVARLGHRDDRAADDDVRQRIHVGGESVTDRSDTFEEAIVHGQKTGSRGVGYRPQLALLAGVNSGDRF
jgi:hypothetical protein